MRERVREREREIERERARESQRVRVRVKERQGASASLRWTEGALPPPLLRQPAPDDSQGVRKSRSESERDCERVQERERKR